MLCQIDLLVTNGEVFFSKYALVKRRKVPVNSKNIFYTFFCELKAQGTNFTKITK